ncbi:MAG TPA: hypothetical protein VFA11_13210 [Acidimicrobiales bacterium]|nr:hypothetical protein [Acidimicrobiales bacterium]
MIGLSGGDWRAQAEALADVAQDVAGIELAEPARRHLVEVVVELLGLLESWPRRGRGERPVLEYLRSHRARLVRHAPWLYDLPPSTRKLLMGTGRVTSLLFFVADHPPPPDRITVRVWRNGLLSLARTAPSEVRTTGPHPAEQPDRSHHPGPAGPGGRRGPRMTATV